MEIIATKTFLKQLKHCPTYIQQSTKVVLEALEKANDLNEVPDVKKLEGYKVFYRIRIGDYRIGMKQQKPQIIVMCILHRGTIYKHFPRK